MKKAFFFDRDGIVNKRIMCGYVTCVEDFEFHPEFFSLFHAVKKAGYLAIIITNQQGIGKGLMTEKDLGTIHRAMQDELQKHTGFAFDDIFYCGDLSSQTGNRRKPSPAMLFEAIDKWDIDAAHSWMIGDSLSDVEAAAAAGIPSILIGDFQTDIPTARYIFPDLLHALEYLNQIL